MSETVSGDEEIELAADAPNLRCRDLTRTFTDAGEALTVLDAVDLDVASGESVAILGASGSGKSTLLHLLGGLDSPTRGSVRIRGQAMHRLTDAARGRLRNRTLGFVYQFHHLLPEFSALENVAMPLLVRRIAAREALASARELLGRVGLGDRLSHRPAQLSGGERQRAAVARALVTRPALVLADEPTGNLDAVTGARVLDLMLELNVEMGASLVVVTHDEGLAERMQTRYRLTAGHLVREGGGLSA